MGRQATCSLYLEGWTNSGYHDQKHLERSGAVCAGQPARCFHDGKSSAFMHSGLPGQQPTRKQTPYRAHPLCRIVRWNSGIWLERCFHRVCRNLLLTRLDLVDMSFGAQNAAARELATPASPAVKAPEVAFIWRRKRLFTFGSRFDDKQRNHGSVFSLQRALRATLRAGSMIEEDILVTGNFWFKGRREFCIHAEFLR